MQSERGRRPRPWPRRQPAADTELDHGRKLIADGWTVEAERWLRDLLTARERARRPDARRLLLTRLVLVKAQLALNRPDDALATLRAARDTAASYQWSRPRTALTLGSMHAFTLVLCGRHAEAEAELVEIAREYHDAPRPAEPLVTAYFSSRLVFLSLLSRKGRFRESLTAVSALLPEMTAARGPEDGLVWQARMSRVYDLAMLGRYDEAAAECRAFLASESKAAGAAGIQGDAACGLAHCLVAQGRPDEAEEAVRGPLDAAECGEGRGSQRAAELRRALAEALVRQGRSAEALALVAGPPAWGVIDAGHHQLVRAEALFALGRRSEAEASAAEALAAAAVGHSPGHVRMLEIRTLLARIHGSSGELDAVAADWVTHYGPDHPRARAARSR